MLVLDKVVLKRFWPADDKGEEDEIVRQVHLQVDAELDNSRQVGELFDSMVRGLVRVSLVDSYTGEEYLLPAVTIKPFNVKQKMEIPLHFHDFLFFRLDHLIDFLNEFIGQPLNIDTAIILFVFGNLVLLLGFFKLINSVPTNVSNSDAAFLSKLMNQTNKILATIFCQFRNG